MDELPKSMRAINELRASGKLTLSEWSVVDKAVEKAVMQVATSMMMRSTPRDRKSLAAHINERRSESAIAR